ncbi:DDE-type integrase/transposase/recombinase [Arsenicicoccus sp. MKL-02]|uniref:DDE-type integrase/transposase/recombinase n=1 Tax=Arsenicicoccus cauae TaxID=2663847 RepID=A0A6I3IAN5_9MICO|nr:DDE-type integrase/transposase/recombinase [Arsenicicoccus cauae]
MPPRGSRRRREGHVGSHGVADLLSERLVVDLREEALGSARPRPGPPVHDDRLAVEGEAGRVRHDFTSAAAPNRVWLTDITEHWTGEGKLYLCALKDACSGRIVGYSIDSRMTSHLAVTALNSAVARRAADGVDVAGGIVHSDRGSQSRSRRFVHRLGRHQLVGSMGRVGACLLTG